MPLGIKPLLHQIRSCDLHILSPQALCSLRGILGLKRYLPNQSNWVGEIYATAEQCYDKAATAEDKRQWLTALYRMTGVFTPLMPTDCYTEDECDERFDDLLADGIQPDDTLLCYRMHRNPVFHTPCNRRLRTAFLNRCHQWTKDLTEANPTMWFSLPLPERLHRLWLLAVTDYKATLHFGSSTPVATPKETGSILPHHWQNILECFYHCTQQFHHINQPDAETLTAYYWTLCQLFPDANGVNAEAYDEFFIRFNRTLTTLTPGTDDWWQLMEIEVHHQKDAAKHYCRHSLPDLSLLSSASMHDFRMTFYHWENQDSDRIDIQDIQDMKVYAQECAERLLPPLDKILSHKLSLSPQLETEYLLTLFLTLRMAELENVLSSVTDRIMDHLPQLPASRPKTHLQTHLHIYTSDDLLFAEAFDTTSTWLPRTLTEEDRYICQYLQESHELLLEQY